MADRDDLPRRPPVGYVYSDGYSGPFQRPKSAHDKYEQDPPGPWKIVGGALGALIAAVLAEIATGSTRGVLIAITVGFVLLVVWGIAQLAEHDGRMKERYGRRR